MIGAEGGRDLVSHSPVFTRKGEIDVNTEHDGTGAGEDERIPPTRAHRHIGR
jgi:hypothetical protein